MLGFDIDPKYVVVGLGALATLSILYVFLSGRFSKLQSYLDKRRKKFEDEVQQHGDNIDDLQNEIDELDTPAPSNRTGSLRDRIARILARRRRRNTRSAED